MTTDGKCYQVLWDEALEIVRVVWLPGAVCGLAEARAVNADVVALGGDTVSLLVDLRDISSIDRPAREFFMDQNSSFRAVAMVAGSPATRMLANFFMGLKRGSIPVKMFTTEAAALVWLREQP